MVARGSWAREKAFPALPSGPVVMGVKKRGWHFV
jgi:hypothetical protein